MPPCSTGQERIPDLSSVTSFFTFAKLYGFVSGHCYNLPVFVPSIFVSQILTPTVPCLPQLLFEFFRCDSVILRQNLNYRVRQVAVVKRIDTDTVARTTIRPGDTTHRAVFRDRFHNTNSNPATYPGIVPDFNGAQHLWRLRL